MRRGIVGLKPAERLPLLERLFAVDLRSLAALRIGLGLVLLLDLITRARLLKELYTDDGVYPTYFVRAITCVHAWGSSTTYEAALFSLTCGAALMLLVGWFTPAATAACWFLVNSLHLRNPTCYDGGDDLGRMVLLWCMFLPLGARWSIDAHRRGPPASSRVLSVAGAALLIQPAFMYLSTAIQKRGPEWLDGTAVWFAVQDDTWSHLLGHVLRNYESLCRWLTYGTRGVELVAPLLLFSPFATRTCRAVGLVALVGFQSGLATCIQLWLFPVFCTLALTPFFPAELWDYVQRRVPTRPRAALAPLPSSSPWTTTVLYAFLTYTVAYGLTNLSGPPLPPRIHSTGEMLGLNTTWAMYAPSPATSESRLSVSLQDANGAERTSAEALDPAWLRSMERMAEDYRAKYLMEHMLSSEIMRVAYSHWICRGAAAGLPRPAVVALRVTTWPIRDRDRTSEQIYEYDCP